MFIIIKKYHIAIFTLLLCTIGIVIGYFSASESTATPPVVDKDVFVLDAGHGGMDGGAVGESGVMEKDINLSVTMYLKEMLEAKGKTVILTRDSDTSLHTTDSKKIRTQKRSDLAYRKKVLEEHAGGTFISIHMNKFEQSKYRGAQVFYADNENSRILGEKIQKSLKEGLADGNNRVAKTIPNTVFILKGVQSRAVVVECGFLSNPEEEKLLATEEYQKKLAQCICNALLEG